MNNKNNDTNQDGQPNIDETHQESDHSIEIVGSPGSHSNSSRSSRQPRVVELLQVNNEVNGDQQPTDWTIGPEFYDIDVAGDSDDPSTDGDLSLEQVEAEEGHEYLDEFQQMNVMMGMARPDRNLESADRSRRRHMQGADGIVDNGEIYVHLDDNDEDEDDDDDDDDNDDDDDLEDYEDYEDDDNPDFVIEPGDEHLASTDSEDDSDQSPANYDISLPVSHRYLGNDLEDARGRQVLIEGSSLTLPVISIAHVVLFPGQVLPIQDSNLDLRIQDYLSTCITRGATTIGVLSNPRHNKIGTTAEIRKFSIQDDKLKLIVEGRQRFELLSARFEIATLGLIKILPEITLGRPYRTPFQRFYAKVNTPSRYIVSKHPYFLLKYYEAPSIMQRIRNQIKDWCAPDMNIDPTDFSYWVASNLPISNNLRIDALSFSCTEARLLWLLSMLERCDVFVCSTCQNVICDKKDVFSMSSYGPQCSFVNEFGYIHDTLTVRHARNLIQDPDWSQEYTWFPGYSWRTAHCGNCNRHVGWNYKRIDQDTKPKRFFGLSRGSVMLHIPDQGQRAVSVTT